MKGEAVTDTMPAGVRLLAIPPNTLSMTPLLVVWLLSAGWSAAAPADSPAGKTPGPVEVQIETVDGSHQRGRLTELSDQQLRWVTAAGEQAVPLDQLLSLTRPQAGAVGAVVAQVGLANGSRVSVDAVLSDGRLVTLRRRGRDAIELPLAQLRWVRYRAAAAAVDSQWLGLVEQSRTADSLVVRRPGDVIDEVAGAVVSFDDQTVSFSLDGDTMQAPLARLEGIVLAPLGGAGNVSSGPVTVETIDGSRWIGDRLISTAADGSSAIAAQLSWGGDLSVTLPWDEIRRVQWSGSTAPLAEQQPASSQYRPLLAIGLSSELSQRWLGAQVIAATDLQMQANSHVEYHVPDGFATLIGSVDFAAEVQQGGLCVVRIWLDDQLVWEQTLDVANASPRGFELPLGEARRVRLEVDSGGDGPVGDQVHFRQPRFVK